MRKVLVLSLLLVFLTGGVVEAQQSSWTYAIPVDEMTGKKDYSREKVYTIVDIEGRDSWVATLILFCETGGLTFSVDQYENSGYQQPVKLDRYKSVAVMLRLKFDNNEPFFIPWMASEGDPGRAGLPSDIPPEIDNIRKEIIMRNDKTPSPVD